ncbi:putative triacylglycerol lipase [Helianthus annuus]|nr:putative triacylglycerol lipase [Helianthus annuus]KAJ0682397.1 putative triacylglycerol lipase [Helianthus annuus]
MHSAFQISLFRPTNMTRELNLLFRILRIVGFIQVTTFVVCGEPQVPCYFIFGDSLVDSGNNNALPTIAKANYQPYGIDFPQGVNGRFTNGRTMADIIGQLLGFPKFIPPYATATDQEISIGVNYASGSAGIREETGSHLGGRISLDRQLVNHKKTISRLSALQSNKTFTDEYLKKCIYLSSIGSNDYINNYLLPSIYPTNITYTLDQYAVVLVQQYSQQLKTIYNLGARKIAVFGLAEIGCTPIEITRFGTSGKLCVEWINNGIKLFNDNLTRLVDDLNSNYSDARFTFLNVTSLAAPLGDLPLPTSPCCTQLRDDGQCVPNSSHCLVRDSTLFFDGLHPTEIAHQVIATRSYKSLLPTDTYPYDISHLARL